MASSDATNPLDSSDALKPGHDAAQAAANPQQQVLPGDSPTTKAEKVERHGSALDGSEGESPAKRIRLDNGVEAKAEPGRQKGIAPIKKEYLIQIAPGSEPGAVNFDDDAAESSGRPSKSEPAAGRGGVKTKGGQNVARNFGSSRDAVQLCRSRAHTREFAPAECPFGDKCKHEHNLRQYLEKGKRADLQDIFGGKCPVLEERGRCSAGWKCRFASSHSKEIEHEDGRKELILLQTNEQGEAVAAAEGHGHDDEEGSVGVVNVTSIPDKIQLRKKKRPTPKSDIYLKWLEQEYEREFAANGKGGKGGSAVEEQLDHRATYVEPPLKPSEKRRIYYGPETPVLAPLTTQGNLPFRRLCVSLGAQVTWSEMAMGLPLLQGEKQEWALMKAHESELASPAYYPKDIVHDYDNSKDIRFGAQIAANKPWLALRTTEVLTGMCPQLRAIDLNCGCPIDLVCRQGAGSSLLDAPGKLTKMLRGMNTVSGEVPITVKIRTGTKDKQPTAEKLCQRLILGNHGEEGSSSDSNDDAAGVAAITLHGRSRQQRYTRSADWAYIAECASLVSRLRASRAAVTDTVREPDARELAPAASGSGLPYFCGNGDILSHVDYNTHLAEARVDAVMVGRGALVKPWLFEEIAANQYLDKSASERLAYVERFVRNGLDYWGADEIGVGTTRRFLLEWLSFACRYVPIGLLEYLPPKFGDRPPAFRGRSEMETLLSSGNYKDWIKISEMFLGPAHKDFQFQPKHRSNSYEIEAEG